MEFPFAIIALLVITWLPNVIPQKYPYYITRPINQTKISRQSSADQMVQNILQWLQGSSLEGIRKVRQDGLRTYLPPITHTQKPRPFEPAPPGDNNIIGGPPPYPNAPEEIPPANVPGYVEGEYSPGLNEIPGPSGSTGTSSPPSEFPNEPSPGLTSGPNFPGEQAPNEPTVTEKAEYPQKETSETPFVPISPSSGPQETSENNGYPPVGPPPQPPFTFPEKPGEEATSESIPSFTPPIIAPQEPIPPETIGYPSTGETPQPSFPLPEKPMMEETPRPSPPIESPYIPNEPIPPESTGYPSAGETPGPPSPPDQETPSATEKNIPSQSTSQPPPANGITGYPSAGESPQPPFELEATPLPSGITGYPPAGETSQPPFEPEATPAAPISPGEESEEKVTSTPRQPGQITASTFPPFIRETTSRELPSRPETETPSPILPSSPPEETIPPENPPQPTLPEVNSSPPPLETTERLQTSPPLLPEVNPSTQQPNEVSTDAPPSPIPSERPGEPEIEVNEPRMISPGVSLSEEDLKHPPHIHAIEVECAKEMMTINIEFNREFNGVIYSKGFYNDPECRYVNENSRLSKYSFTVKLNSCGTQFVNAFDTENQSYLENILVLQNEVGIQEVWDTIRAVRCLWEGNLSKSLTVSLSIGMLSEEIVTFSGDTAVARLDIQRGEGPFAPSANGLVPIGEKMTLVISVSGDPGFDLQVKECKAKDADGKLEYTLTDENGCVLRPKLFGAFQKTRNTENTGASIIAYAFFNAFKFPDLMDLMIECNVELCKTDCDVCPDPNQKLQPGKRRRRDVYNETIGEPVKVGRYLRVLLPQDLSDGEKIVPVQQLNEDKICLSLKNFIITTVFLISLAVCSFFYSIYLLLKYRFGYYKQQQ